MGSCGVIKDSAGKPKAWYDQKGGKPCGNVCWTCGKVCEAWTVENMAVTDCIAKWTAGDIQFKREFRFASKIFTGSVQPPWNPSTCSTRLKVGIKVTHPARVVRDRDFADFLGTCPPPLKAFQ